MIARKESPRIRALRLAHARFERAHGVRKAQYFHKGHP